MKPDFRALRRGWPLQIKVSALVVAALASLAFATGLSNYLYFRSVLKQEATARGKAISIGKNRRIGEWANRRGHSFARNPCAVTHR